MFSNDRLGILHGITLDDSIDTPRHSAASGYVSESKKRSYPERDRPDSADMNDTEAAKDTKSRNPSKFRFKKKRKNDSGNARRHADSHGRPSNRRKDRRAPLEDDPTQYDDSYTPNAASWNHAADPDAAFRESLFDAMADDEGAEFWEGVYGQPIHVYERPGVKDERGELEKMTDEEYTRYVRERMWEKSHQHIVREREQREKAREKRKRDEESERMECEKREKERRTKERLRREQRDIERMRKRWDDYLEYWDTHAKAVGDSADIPWPTFSGRATDVTKEAVERFFTAFPRGEGQSLQDVLKTERIRWHPDKAQQRWGLDALSQSEMKAITTAFQTIDAMWAVHRNKAEMR
jgi:hypothetical protein